MMSSDFMLVAQLLQSKELFPCMIVISNPGGKITKSIQKFVSLCIPYLWNIHTLQSFPKSLSVVMKPRERPVQKMLYN